MASNTALPTWYAEGTASVENGSDIVTGTGTTWTVLAEGDIFGTHVDRYARIEEIISATEIRLARPWAGPTQVGAPYEIQLTPRNVGVSEATRQMLIELRNGNLPSLATLAGSAGKIPMFSAPGVFTMTSKGELVSGVEYNVTVANLAARAAYDGNEEGFSVLVRNVSGSNRAALYEKLSNASGDWSDPAWITGETGATGPYMGFAVEDVETLPPGTLAEVVPNFSVPGTIGLTFKIPRGVPGDVAGPDGGVEDGQVVAFDGPSGKALKGTILTSAEISFNNSIAQIEGSPTSVKLALEALSLKTKQPGQNDSYFALEIAQLKNARMNMVGGVVDPLLDQLGVNLGFSQGIDPFTVSYLKFDAPNNKTTIVDSANVDEPHRWNVFGDAKISTAQSVFGDSSLFLDGTVDHLRGDGSADFAFPAGTDFTIDFFFRRNVVGVAQTLMDFRTAATSICILIDILATNFVRIYVNAAARITGTIPIAVDTWYHFALVRSAGVTRMYINGVQDGAAYTDANAYVVNAQGPTIGAQLAGAAPLFTGYIDNLRISKGVARWTDAFTPPTEQYALPSDTTTQNQFYEQAQSRYRPALVRDRLMAVQQTTVIAVSTGINYRNQILPAMVKRSANFIRLQFAAGATSSKRIENVFIGRATIGGNAWDMVADPAPVRVTFNGGDNFVTPPINGAVWSDWIEFPLDANFAHIVALNVDAAPTANIGTTGSVNALLYNVYTKTAANETDQLTPTGYAAAAGQMVALVAIEGKDSDNIAEPMWLESETYTALSSPTHGHIMVQTMPDVELAAGADILCDVSRNGGVGWSPCVLKKTYDLSGIAIFEGEAPFVGGHGTQMKWRVRTDNGKFYYIAGVTFSWR